MISFSFCFSFFLFLMLGATGFELFFGCLGGHYWILWVYLEKFSFPVEEFMLLQQQAFVYGLNVWIPNFVSGSVLLQNFKRNLLKLLMGFIFILFFIIIENFQNLETFCCCGEMDGVCAVVPLWPYLLSHWLEIPLWDSKL